TQGRDLVVHPRVAQVAHIAAHDLAATAIVGVLADLPASPRQADRADRIVHAQVAQVRDLVAEAHRLAAIVGVAIDGDRGLAPTAAARPAVVPPAARTPRTAAVLEVALEAAAGQTAVAVDDLFAGAARQFDRGFAHIAPHVAAIRIEAAAIHIGPRAALGVGPARREIGS